MSSIQDSSNDISGAQQQLTNHSASNNQSSDNNNLSLASSINLGDEQLQHHHHHHDDLLQHQEQQQQHSIKIKDELPHQHHIHQQQQQQQNIHQKQMNDDNNSTAARSAVAALPQLSSSSELEQQQQQHQQQSANSNTTSPAFDHITEQFNSTIPQRNPSEDLFSSKPWGRTAIKQDTPWELPPSPMQPNQTTVAVGSSSSALPPGISQSSDSFCSSSSANAKVNDFHATPTMANNFGVDGISANGLVNSLGQMNLGAGVLNSARFVDQTWRSAPLKQQQPSMASSFANHNLMNSAAGSMQKSLQLNSGNGIVGVQVAYPGSQTNEFARAPGPASSIMDNNMTPKPFGMANRSSTWSAFGTATANDSEPEWPKSTTSGISTGSSHHQQQNAFDLVPEFEPGKPWHGSMLMKGLDDDQSLTPGSSGLSNNRPQQSVNQDCAFTGNSFSSASSAKSPIDSQYESSGIGTWSPVVKSNRPGSKWDGDGPDNGRGDNGRFDDGTAIWGSPAQNKVSGVDWVEKTGVSGSRSVAGNNQCLRPQQASTTSLLMSSNTSPANQQARNLQPMKQPTLSHNFDQMQQQQPNALSSQANQPNRGLGLSSNVPSTQQLKHMVQQIQLAVQAGHLNAQILNQPLSPITLQLLCQLLQQIKVLQQLQQQASAAQQFSKSGSHPNASINVHITKTKQSILNLQNQIAAQQAIYLKSAENISSRRPTMPNLAAGVGSIGPALPPGISQSGDSFRSNSAVNDFLAPSMVNNFGIDNIGANGLANSLNPMNFSGAGGMHSSRFDQPWRAPAAKHQPSISSASPFASHNLMNPASGSMQKPMLSSGNGIGVSYANEFARAPGPASSIMDNNMTPKPFGMANRSSTWSAFGSTTTNDSEPEWPKSTASGISTGNSNQHQNAFDLVPEFEPGKPWRGSMLMKSVEDDPTMTPGSVARPITSQRKTIWSDEIL